MLSDSLKGQGTEKVSCEYTIIVNYIVITTFVMGEDIKSNVVKAVPSTMLNFSSESFIYPNFYVLLYLVYLIALLN